MSDVTNPILTIRIDLPRRLYVRCVIWTCLSDLRTHTPEVSRKDYRALFVEASGRCIGTIHLSADDFGNGIRAHEIRHAVDHYAFYVYREELADVTEKITDAIDKAVLSLG